MFKAQNKFIDISVDTPCACVARVIDIVNWKHLMTTARLPRRKIPQFKRKTTAVVEARHSLIKNYYAELFAFLMHDARSDV